VVAEALEIRTARDRQLGQRFPGRSGLRRAAEPRRGDPFDSKN
jgi:hypothetical protein